jgi:hypothetical protein
MRVDPPSVEVSKMTRFESENLGYGVFSAKENSAALEVQFELVVCLEGYSTRKEAIRQFTVWIKTRPDLLEFLDKYVISCTPAPR